MHGVDTYMRVTSDAVVDEATNLLGVKPKYWGRYFSGIDYRGGGEYFRKLENNTLRKHDIRVLPIGRYTTQVGLGQAEGERDGFDQAQDFLVTFGEDYLKSSGGEFYLFLDVEPSDPLSADYYTGWSYAVSSISSEVKILPCVYLGVSDAKTSRELSLAVRKGAKCHGLWVANYGSRFRTSGSPRLDFDPSKASPATGVPVPVLFWQFAGEIDGDYDFNVSNPGFRDDDLLKHFVLPQPIS